MCFQLKYSVIGDPVGAKNSITQWVKKQTSNSVSCKDFIPNINPNTSMILVNAIFFHGKWSESFDPTKTSKKPFYVNQDTIVETFFLFARKEFFIGCNEDLDCQLLGIPYENQYMSFILLVPNQIDGLAVIETQLTCSHVTDLHSKFNVMKAKAKVCVPKFKMEQDNNMNDVLKAMGMKGMFSRKAADFSGVNGTDEVYVNHVLHKAAIIIDEESVCVPVQRPRSSSVTKVQTITADHPFLYFIRDNRNGSVLFMGRYCQPPPN